MSEDIGTIVISGNISAVEDVQYGADGMARVRIRFASNRRAKGRDGTWGEETMWCSTTVFGGRAEPLARILSKGDKICVSGELVVRSYEKRDGTTGIDVCIERSSVALMGSKRDGESRGNGGGGREQSKRTDGVGYEGYGPADAFPADDFSDGEIPF